MSEKKSYREKADRLLEAFSELIKEDIEEAREVLRAAGKDVDKLAEEGLKKINQIRKNAVRAQRRKASGNYAGGDNPLPFPVFMLDETTEEVYLSAEDDGSRILNAGEVYAVLAETPATGTSFLKVSEVSEEAGAIRLQRFLKDIIFSVRMDDRTAQVSAILAGPDTGLSYPALQLILKTGYFIENGKCFPVDEEVLVFTAWLLKDIDENMTMPLHVSLDLFSKRAEFSLLRFAQQSADLNLIFASGSYQTATPLFVKELYPYQRDGVSWLTYCCINRTGGILADDMGLGKTAQVIALIANLISRSVLKNILIVVPGTLLENWRREFAFFAPELKPFIHHGGLRTGFADDLLGHQIIITSYSMIINDINVFNEISWGLTILDEASLIKNPDAERRTALKRLTSAVKIAMTGTPVENSLTDLWSLADYVQPGYLGSKTEFNSKYGGKNQFDLGSPGLARLRDDISFIMLRRKKEDVLDNLPERIDIHQALTMNSSEAAIYESKRDEILSTAAASGAGSHILQLITELRMYTTHPLLRDPAALASAGINELRQTSFKFGRMLELLHEIAVKKEKVLIFTEFLNMIDTLKRVLPHLWPVEILTIDGRIETTERQANIDRFSASAGFAIMVLNPKTAGMGLNITAANHVIHYTRQWNPALEEQASARAYRNGQKKAVNIYYLYYASTIEETIDERLRKKMALSGEVITVTETENMEDYLNALKLSPLN